MSTLTAFQMILFAFTPLVFTVGLLTFIAWRWAAKAGPDGPRRLLDAAVRRTPEERRDWGAAMLVELDQFEGSFARWRFALGCARAALLPPATTAWLRYLLDAFKRFGSGCGIMSVALPPLGVPLLWCAAAVANRVTTHDDFFNGEFVPGLVGAFILFSFALTLIGVPLGIAGLVRRERVRWLAVMGPILSIGVFSYLMIVQHLAAKNLN